MNNGSHVTVVLYVWRSDVKQSNIKKKIKKIEK